MDVVTAINEPAFLPEDMAERGRRGDHPFQSLRFRQGGLIGHGRAAVGPRHLHAPAGVAIVTRSCERMQPAAPWRANDVVVSAHRVPSGTRVVLLPRIVARTPKPQGGLRGFRPRRGVVLYRHRMTIGDRFSPATGRTQSPAIDHGVTGWSGGCENGAPRQCQEADGKARIDSLGCAVSPSSSAACSYPSSQALHWRPHPLR